MDESSFHNAYQLYEVIGRGSSSLIRRCVSKLDGTEYAVKIIDVAKLAKKPDFNVDSLKYEASICQMLKHPNIVEMVETCSSDGQLYMIFELMEGEDLFFEIVKRARAGFVYSESVASHYMRQIVEAMRYCHGNQITHGNLRPNCVMLSNRDNSAPLKIVGFQSAYADPESKMIDYISDEHLQYRSPELLRQESWGTASDVWAMGVLLYILLSGQPPFNGTKQHLKQNILKAAFNLKSEIWSLISDDAKDLLHRMLELDIQHRISVEDILKHPWIKDRIRPPKIHLHEVVNNLYKFNNIRRLKMSIQTAMSNSSWLTNDPIFEQNESHINYAVEQIECKLDDIRCLMSSDLNEEDHQYLFNDQQLGKILQIFDEISTKVSNMCSAPQTISSFKLSKQICDRLLEEVEVIDEVNQLVNILASPVLQCALLTHDISAYELFSEDSGVRYMSPPLPAKDYNWLERGGVDGALSDTLYPDCGALNDGEFEQENIMRVRLVQFQKNTDEPMGITLKVNEVGQCLVARIMYGGMIHKQGTLHVGDEICEINNISVHGQTVEALQRTLRVARGSISLKIIPTFKHVTTHCEMYVRALFTYCPEEDDLIPCPQAGVAFKMGDILQVISKDDYNWWQAVHWGVDVHHPAGLIPSPELQEWRSACAAIDKAKRDQSVHCSWFSRKKRQCREKYLVKHNTIFDQLDLATYEEVTRVTQYSRKTIVLLGAHGVGRRHIKNTLISNNQAKYAYPIPHTTRTPRADEEHGKNYFFVTHEQMMADIAANEYLEYGTHEDSMYGTKLDTIRSIHNHGLIAILDVEPQALKVLRTAEYAPFVVFIAAPRIVAFVEDGSLERLSEESENLEQMYGHYFDLTIVNNDIEETIVSLQLAIDLINTKPQWVPIGWVF